MSAGQLALEDYRAQLAQQARSTGERRSVIGAGFDEALDLIRRWPPEEQLQADDLRPLQRRGSPAVLGAAFAEAAKRGLIVFDGISTARAASARGRLVRTWRRTAA